MPPTLLGLLIKLLFGAWLVGLIIHIIDKTYDQYFRSTGRIIRNIWRNHWKLIIGILIGWVLSIHYSVELLSR